MKKKSKPKKRTTHKKTKQISNSNTEKILIENFVSLQKVITNLSINFDNLSNQISKLLKLFEASAETLTRKDFDLEKGEHENKEIVKKLDNLAEQNKIIAKGLTLIHESKIENENTVTTQTSPTDVPETPLIKEIGGNQQGTGSEKYQKSISSTSTNFKKYN